MTTEPTAPDAPAPEADPFAPFSRDLEALIGENQAAWSAMDEAEPEAPAGTPAEPPTELPAEVTPPAPPAPPEPNDDPAVLRGLDRLVARESEIAAREARLLETERRLAAAEQHYRELVEYREAAERRRAEAAGDPEAQLAASGVDPDQLVRLHLAKRLGDKAPPELRQELRDHEREQRIRQLEARLEAKEAGERAAAQHAQWEAQVTQGVKAHLSQALPTFPGLAELAKRDAERPEREILDEIRRDAQWRIANKEPLDSPILSYAEAAKRVNERYAFLAGAPAPSPAPAPPAAASTPAPSTQVGTGAPTQSGQKPRATRPLMPWMTQDQRDYQDLAEEAIRAAVADARRATRKSG